MGAELFGLYAWTVREVNGGRIFWDFWWRSLETSVGDVRGCIIEEQEDALCPTHPHSKQMAEIPLYWTRWRREPVRTLEVSGESKSIWIQRWAYRPRTLSMVHVSILRRWPSWLPILWRMELSYSSTRSLGNLAQTAVVVIFASEGCKPGVYCRTERNCCPMN